MPPTSRGSYPQLPLAGIFPPKHAEDVSHFFALVASFAPTNGHIEFAICGRPFPAARNIQDGVTLDLNLRSCLLGRPVMLQSDMRLFQNSSSFRGRQATDRPAQLASKHWPRSRSHTRAHSARRSTPIDIRHRTADHSSTARDRPGDPPSVSCAAPASVRRTARSGRACCSRAGAPGGQMSRVLKGRQARRGGRGSCWCIRSVQLGWQGPSEFIMGEKVARLSRETSGKYNPGALFPADVLSGIQAAPEAEALVI